MMAEPTFADVLKAAVDLADQGVFADLDEMVAWVVSQRPTNDAQNPTEGQPR